MLVARPRAKESVRLTGGPTGYGSAKVASRKDVKALKTEKYKFTY